MKLSQSKVVDEIELSSSTKQPWRDRHTHAWEASASLAANYLETIAKQYAGTRLERQELNADLIDDVAGALWTRRFHDLCRLADAQRLFSMQRIVVAIDPAAKAGNEKDRTSETGPIVAGLGRDERGYGHEVLSRCLLPRGWECKALAAYDRYEADAALVVEINQGGAALVWAHSSSTRQRLSHE